MNIEIGGNLLIACIVASLCALFARISARRLVTESKSTTVQNLSNSNTHTNTNANFSGPMPPAMLNALNHPQGTVTNGEATKE